MDLALPAASAMLSAYVFTGGLPALVPFLIATFGAYCAITSSYVLNDFYDMEVDKIGMPGRPLPSAKVSRSGALAYALLLLGLAAASALYLNPESFVTLVAATVVITIYSGWAKKNTPFSWVLVGLAYGIVPLGVWLAISPVGFLKVGPGLHPASLLLASMICITDWGFTNCDASRDVEGDRKNGIPTLPVTYGISSTANIVAIFWIIGIILSIGLGLSAGLGMIYLAAAGLAGAWLLSQNLGFVRNPTAEMGNSLFLQSANYRAVLFAALILDLLLRTALGFYHGIAI
jgi:4-hydroxybenzoate polyprenyltransferase